MVGAIGGGLLGGIAGGATVSIVISAIDRFSKTFANVNKGLVMLGGAMTLIGLAGAAAVGGLVKMAGQFEQTQIAFTTMLGSAEKADKLLKELADFAARTPFTIPGIEQNAKMLLAMSIPLEDLLPTLKSLGDIASGLNVPMERLALNFGQVKVQGKLTGRELRDFSVAGVPLIAELAKNLNISEAAVKDLVSAGKIGFPEVERAFQTMTGEGGKFFDLMDAQSKTLLGQISNIQDSFIKIGRVMGEVFLPAAKLVAEHLAIIVDWMEQHPKLAKFAAVLLGVVTALTLIGGPILIAIALMPVLIGLFTGLTIASFGFLIPIALIAAAVIAVVALFVWWDEIILALTKAALWAAKTLDKAWNWLSDGFVIMWAQIKNAAIIGWNFLVDLYQKGVQKLFNFLTPVFNLINKASQKLGFGEIINVSAMQQQINSISALKGEIEDITALKQKLADERAFRASEFERVSNEMYEQIKLQRLGTEEAEKQLEISDKQTEELKAQNELIENLSSYKVLYSRDPTTGKITYGDVFKPTAFSKEEFQSKYAYEQAKLGAGITINIENISGLDPDEIAAALQNKLGEMIS